MLQTKNLLSASVEALLPAAAVVLALIIGAVMLLALGVNPLNAYGAMPEGVVGSVSGFTQALVKATPLLLVGLGICIAFRGGVINIGGEGQLIVGALALALPQLSGVILLPLTLVAGVLASDDARGITGQAINVDGEQVQLLNGIGLSRPTSLENSQKEQLNGSDLDLQIRPRGRHSVHQHTFALSRTGK